MKQSVSILLLCISLSLSSFSQGIYGELEGGYNFPLGQFKTATGFGGGAVYPGFHAGGAVGYKLNPTWSFGIRYIHTRNETNGLANISRRALPVWKNNAFLLTTKISRPILENFYAELEGQAGYMWSSFPFTFSIGLNTMGFSQPQSSGFVSGARIGFKYYLKEKLAYKMSINYLGATVDNSNDWQILPQNVSLALLSVGLLLEL